MTESHNTKLICPNCFSLDAEAWDEFTCSWCGQIMKEIGLLTHEDQAKAWKHLNLTLCTK
jgi:hypothetical protein